MAGIALKGQYDLSFHNGRSGGVIKIKRNLFRKKGSLKKNYHSIFIGEFCAFSSIITGMHRLKE